MFFQLGKLPSMGHCSACAPTAQEAAERNQQQDQNAACWICVDEDYTANGKPAKAELGSAAAPASPVMPLCCDSAIG